MEQIGYQLEGWALDSLLVEDFERPFSVLENAFSKTENANHEIENAFSKTKNPFSKTEEHYINTNTHIHEHTHTNGVSVGKGKTAKSEFKREQIEEYFTEIARTDKNIQSVSALARSRWMDGTEDEKIRIYYEAKHQQTQEPRRKFTTEPCPKCSGTKVEIVPKKGARPCDSCLDDLGKPTGFKPLE